MSSDAYIAIGGTHEEDEGKTPNDYPIATMIIEDRIMVDWEDLKEFLKYITRTHADEAGLHMNATFIRATNYIFEQNRHLIPVLTVEG